MPRLLGETFVKDNAQVYDNAKVDGDQITLRKNAQVYGNAEVSGKVYMDQNAKVYGNAQVRGTFRSEVNIWGNARIGGTAIILGGTWDGSEGEITEGTWTAPGEEDVLWRG